MLGRMAEAAAVIPEWTFADRLRKSRQIAGMDQRVFALHLGVKSSAYAQWEAGNNKPRDVVAVAKRVELLTHVPATWLLDLGDGWAPWGSNPQPTVGAVAQVIAFDRADGARRRSLHPQPSGYVSAQVAGLRPAV